MATAFDYSIVEEGLEKSLEVDGKESLQHGRIYEDDEMWENLEYWIKIITPIIIDFVAAAPTYPVTISIADKGAERISLIVPINLGKYIPKEAFEILWVKTVSMIRPGTINAP